MVVIHHKNLASNLCSISPRIYYIQYTGIIGYTSNTIKMTESEDKQLWSSNQKYNQQQMDMIHAYLCHSNWQERVHRFSERNKSHKIPPKDCFLNQGLNLVTGLSLN